MVERALQPVPDLAESPTSGPETSTPLLMIGHVGTQQVAELVGVDPIPTPDGAIGYQVGQLQDALKHIDPRSIIWLPKPSSAEEERAIALYAGGQIVIDNDARRVTIQGQNADFPRLQFDILSYLALNKGIVRTRSDIFIATTGSDVARENDRSVDTSVYNIRKKLGDLAPVIQSVPGVGYMFDDTSVVAEC